MADYSALKAEQAKPEFTGQTSAQVAATLNALTVQVPVPVSLGRLAGWAAKTGARAKIGAAAANSASPVQSICLAVLDMLQGLAGPPLDLSNTDNQAMLGALVQVGVVTQADAATLSAMGYTLSSRALQLAGWNLPATSNDIDHTRTL